MTQTRKKTPRQVIQAFMKKHNMDTGGCRPFYTPKEWQARGEDYGTRSLLIVCHDGGDLAKALNLDYGNYKLNDEIAADLRAEGYFVEQCTSWYSAVWEI